MAALSGERSCQDSRRAKRQGLLTDALYEARGSLAGSISSPQAYKDWPAVTAVLSTRGKARPIQLSRSRFCFMERGHPVRLRAQPAHYPSRIRHLRAMLKRTGCPQSELTHTPGSSPFAL